MVFVNFLTRGKAQIWGQLSQMPVAKCPYHAKNWKIWFRMRTSKLIVVFKRYVYMLTPRLTFPGVFLKIFPSNSAERQPNKQANKPKPKHNLHGGGIIIIIIINNNNNNNNNNNKKTQKRTTVAERKHCIDYIGRIACWLFSQDSRDRVETSRIPRK